MELKKLIAKKEEAIFGGKMQVFAYWNDSNTVSIDILKCENVPQKGVQCCGTIGLSETDIGLVSGGKELRVEILGASDIKDEVFENIIASSAFAVMQSHKCFPGYILEDVVTQYIDDSDMKHVLLVEPFLWENTESFTYQNKQIAWLMTVPISDREMAYADTRGLDALEDLFEENEIDVYDLYRESVI